MKKLQPEFKRIAMLAAVFVLVLGIATPAFATESAKSGATSSSSSDSSEYGTYYRNWEEYTKANKPAYEEEIWKFHDIKDAILQVLDAGKKAIEAGDNETARQCGNDGYYGFYALEFKNATNMYISGSRVKQLELLFGELRTLGADGNKEEYEKVCDEIEKDVQEDADKLDGEDLDKDSFSSEMSSISSSNSSSSSDSTTAESSTRSATTVVSFGNFFDFLRKGFEAIIRTLTGG